MTKYVASTTQQGVEWQNSTLINGDVAEEVAKLKQRPGKNIAVLGSGPLVQTLIEHDLVDSKATSTGGVMLTYRPA